jgi:hypothetical protein
VRPGDSGARIGDWSSFVVRVGVSIETSFESEYPKLDALYKDIHAHPEICQRFTYGLTTARALLQGIDVELRMRRQRNHAAQGKRGEQGLCKLQSQTSPKLFHSPRISQGAADVAFGGMKTGSSPQG